MQQDFIIYYFIFRVLFMFLPPQVKRGALSGSTPILHARGLPTALLRDLGLLILF